MRELSEKQYSLATLHLAHGGVVGNITLITSGLLVGEMGILRAVSKVLLTRDYSKISIFQTSRTREIWTVFWTGDNVYI